MSWIWRWLVVALLGVALVNTWRLLPVKGSKFNGELVEEKVMAQLRADMKPEMQSIEVVKDQNGGTVEISEWCIKGRLYTRFVQGETVNWKANSVQLVKTGFFANSVASVPETCEPKHQIVKLSKKLTDEEIAALQAQPEHQEFMKRLEEEGVVYPNQKEGGSE